MEPTTNRGPKMECMLFFNQNLCHIVGNEISAMMLNIMNHSDDHSNINHTFLCLVMSYFRSSY